MDIAVIGAGRIGGNIAAQLARAGHALTLAFSRDPAALAARAADLGATAAAPADAVAGAEVVVVAVPWSTLPDALEQMGPLDGRIVIDTTNQYGAGPKPAAGETAAAFNAARMPGARYTKAFNTLTSGFQAQAAGRTGADRVVMFLCGDDEEAKRVVAGLIDDAGFTAVDMGGTADAAPMEAPRRPGAVYGEEFHEHEARAFVANLRST
jgi:8-hydroxy-5-deazaflavin:NADPH oxidoreductase